MRGNGSIDDKEEKVLGAAWMDVNKESIFDTRPWAIFGEGHIAERANPINAQGFNEGIIKKLGAADIDLQKKTMSYMPL